MLAYNVLSSPKICYLSHNYFPRHQTNPEGGKRRGKLNLFAPEIGVQGFEFMVGINGLRFRILGFGCGIQDSWMWVQMLAPQTLNSKPKL